MTAYLKLRAQDGEDIQILSAVLQDSIVPICDMAFDPEAKSFVIVAQRLRREAGTAGSSERICSALTVKGVLSVQAHGIDQKQQKRMYDLLAVILEPTQHLSLIFAGDARIRLELGDWAAAVEDFGEAWPALCNPCHDEAMQAKG